MADTPKPAPVINLNRARKDRARAAKAAGAEANRARHGATKADKSLSAARKDKAGRDLDAHRRQKDQDGEPSDN